MNTNIQFGFWNYVPCGMLGKEAVKDWKEMGMTVAMSFDFDDRIHQKTDILELLDECQKYDIKLMIRDKRTRFRRYMKRTETEFLEGVREAYADFGKHPATFGFFVGDEPSPQEEEAYIATLRILVEEMPDLVPFNNTFAYWGGSDYLMLTGRKTERYDQLVERILSETKTPVIGFDCYAQCAESNFNQETGIDTWFHNLDMWYKHCKKHGTMLYVSALCVGHWSHRVPTEDDIRWQINTALAHGARGIVWFHLYNYAIEDDSYRNAPFYGKNFKRTEMFTYIARQQDLFHQYYEEQFNKMEVTEVYHTGHLYNPECRLCEDEIIQEVTGRFAYPTIVTYYKEYASEERWVSIVNASQRNVNQLTVKFTCGVEKSFWLEPGGMKLFKLSELQKEAQK